MKEGVRMDREKLIRKLDGMLDEADRDQMWGNIEIQIQNGIPTVLRKLTTERLTDSRETTRGKELSKKT
jgi:hypothetical protein